MAYARRARLEDARKMTKRVQANGWLESGDRDGRLSFRVSHSPADHPFLVKSQEVSMGKLTAEQKVREYNRGQKAASEGRSRSWSEPWAYPFESDQHYEERREAFNQGYGIIDATPMSARRSPP